jgi:hypothetical protein
MRTRRIRRDVNPTLEQCEGRQLLSGLSFIVKPGHTPRHLAEPQTAAVTQITVIARPDLKINAFYLDRYDRLVITIGNCGTVPVSNFEVELSQKTKLVHDRRTAKVTVPDTILPLHAVTKYYNVSQLFGRPTNLGHMHYTVMLDPAYKIPELNESNNFAEFDA